MTINFKCRLTTYGSTEPRVDMIPVRATAMCGIIYMIPVWESDDRDECMICFDTGGKQFVVVDCEYDAQSRMDAGFPMFHDTFAEAKKLWQYMVDDNDRQERAAQLVEARQEAIDAINRDDWPVAIAALQHLASIK